MSKSLITVTGYILFVLGFLSILLSMVGRQLTPLRWLSSLGPGLSILIKVVMLFGGLVIMYFSKFPPTDEA